MAKAASKPGVKKETKPSSPKSKSNAAPELHILKACETALKKLNELDLDHQLQSEINWCLGSFHADGNPIGLYQMAQRSLELFRAEQSKKTKGITAKLISDIEKALNGK